MDHSSILLNVIIFMLASFLGIELIRHVSRHLHTPLMSLTNAISSVSIVAALIVMSHATGTFIITIVLIAIASAATNAVGGFLITERILKMFRRDEKR